MPTTRRHLFNSGWRNIVRRIPAGSVLALTGENGSQTTIPDWSGSSNDGTITGATWDTLPSELKYLKFDGDDLINIDVAVNDLATTTTGTWEGWFKLTDATPAAAMRLISFGDTDANEYLTISINTNGTFSAGCVIAGVAAWSFATDAAAVSDNTWVHLALTHNATAPILYVSGVAVAQTFTITTDKTKWFSGFSGLDNGRIGCLNKNSGGNAEFLTGAASLVRINTTALSAGTLLNHVNTERQLLGV